MDWRETAIFAPLIVGALALGVFPHLITDVTSASVHQLIDMWRAGASG